MVGAPAGFTFPWERPAASSLSWVQGGEGSLTSRGLWLCVHAASRETSLSLPLCPSVASPEVLLPAWAAIKGKGQACGTI